LGIAVISNVASGITRHRVSHEEIMAVMERRKGILSSLIAELCRQPGLY